MNILDRAIEAQKAGDFAAAERLYRETIAWSFNNLAFVNLETQDFPRAERFYRDALAADPEHADAAFGLAILLLAEGRYAEAWPLHEARRRLPRIYTPSVHPVLREWRGEDLQGRRIAVFGEQGFGDQIMFARFLRQLEGRGASTTYFCAAEVSPLIAGSRFTVNAEVLSQYDFWAYVGSLPWRLGTTLDSLPPPFPLPAGAGGGGIGVMTRGRPTNFRDQDRSLDAETAEALLKLGVDLHPEATGARDFGQTAAIIQRLDLVITVDTAVAHLAASMGKPTWILLARRLTDWRWLRERADSPWYPSVRLFRQRQRGDWREVVAEVRQAAGTLSSKT